MMRQRSMQTKTNAQMGLLNSLMIATPTNEFLERLDRSLDWQPIEQALQAMYPATTGRPPCAPLALFKMSLLQHCHGLSDPQCEELVGDRLSWRRFVGLGLSDAVPDETTPVRFRQRLREHGLHENLLALVNRQLQAARRAPARADTTGSEAHERPCLRFGKPSLR